MGRKVKISEKALLAAYNKAHSLIELSTRLGVSTVTVRQYLQRYGLAMYDASKPKQMYGETAKKVFKHYRGLRTIRSIAEQFELPVRTVRYMLEKELASLYRTDPPQWPMPYKLTQIKLIRELIEADEMGDHALWDDPERMAESTGLTIEAVKEYQEYAFEIMHRKTTKQKGK